MNLELFREYCLKKKGVTEELPFGPDTLVFKVMGKLFALCGLDDVPGSCNLKCDPIRAEELRERFSSIIPGYHMNKKHWNTIVWDGSVADQLILELIDHSYDLVAEGLPPKLRDEIKKGAVTKNIKQASKKKKKKKLLPTKR
ncbi:MAG TPA: MmcQ/YjbR family DNA-binding protein [Chitinophagales bacterium]|nr:MmcQ/YjbR family DNA-binding protein [Chitinophagales bacterium]